MRNEMLAYFDLSHSNWGGFYSFFLISWHEILEPVSSTSALSLKAVGCG